jgi:hypothetical protein
LLIEHAFSDSGFIKELMNATDEMKSNTFNFFEELAVSGDETLIRDLQVCILECFYENKELKSFADKNLLPATKVFFESISWYFKGFDDLKISGGAVRHDKEFK